MPVFAFTAGSLGDIVSLLQITKTIIQALCDSRGSSAEYVDLILELDSVVRAVEGVQYELSIEGPNKLPAPVENGLHYAIRGCLDLLRQIDSKISAWRRGFGSGWTFGKDAWLRLGWCLFTREELIGLRRRLSGQIEAMNTLLILAHGERLERFSRKQDKHALEIRRKQDEYASKMHQKQEEIKSEIHRVMNGITGRGNPRRDGYVSKQLEFTEGRTSRPVRIPARGEASWPGWKSDTDIEYTPPPSPLSGTRAPQQSIPSQNSPELEIDGPVPRAWPWATWQPDPNIEYTPPPSSLDLQPSARPQPPPRGLFLPRSPITSEKGLTT